MASAPHARAESGSDARANTQSETRRIDVLTPEGDYNRAPAGPAAHAAPRPSARMVLLRSSSGTTWASSEWACGGSEMTELPCERPVHRVRAAERMPLPVTPAGPCPGVGDVGVCVVPPLQCRPIGPLRTRRACGPGPNQQGAGIRHLCGRRDHEEEACARRNVSQNARSSATVKSFLQSLVLQPQMRKCASVDSGST